MSVMPMPFQPMEFRKDDNFSNVQMIDKRQLQQSKQLPNPQTHNQSKQYEQNCCYEKKQVLQKFVENIYFQIFITVFTIVSLFLQDFRILFIEISSDQKVDIVNIIFIVVFTTELMLSLSIPGYFLSFFFFLDILSTLSIVLDISMFTAFLYSSISTGINLSYIIKNSKTSRAVARTVRVMKIFRLARIVKLYKSASKTKQLKLQKLKQQMDNKLQQMRVRKLKQAQANLLNSNDQIIQKQSCQSKEQVSLSQFIGQNELTKSAVFQSDNNISIVSNQKLKASRKLYNKSQQNQVQQLELQNKSQFVQIKQQSQQVTPKLKNESKISKLLSDSTMKKIILVILLIMFSVPILDIDNYYPQTNAWDFLTDYVVAALYNPDIEIQKINALIQNTIASIMVQDASNEILVIFKTPFIQLYHYDSGQLQSQRVGDMIVAESDFNVQQVAQLRNNTLTVNTSVVLNTVTVILSCKQYNQVSSWFSISKIIFICIGIIYLLNAFNDKITQLITDPIQKMLQDIKNNNGKTDLFEYKNAIQNKQGAQKGTQMLSNNYETIKIHQALSKISVMMNRIFGIKGKQEIYNKIFELQSISNSFLKSCRSTFCLVGICHIENYHQISSILQHESLKLNSQVSSYVHWSAYRYGCTGMINLQGSFIIVFQCPKQYINLVSQQTKNTSKLQLKFNKNRSKNILKLKKPRIKNNNEKINYFFEQQKTRIQSQQYQNNNYLNIFADFSIYSLVKSMVKISKEPMFLKYRKNSKLIKQFGQNFQIKLNCALHAGWLQAGFVGSQFKLNYSYLGKCLQQLKTISNYSVQKFSNALTITQDAYNLISFGMKRYTRIIQKYKNESKDINQLLFLVDLNLQNITPPKDIMNKKNKQETTSIYLKKMLNFEALSTPENILQYKAASFINCKKQLRQVMKNVISEQFRRKYILAYQNFVRGQIQECKQILEQLQAFNKEDVLIMKLMNAIQDSQCNPSQVYRW